MKIDRINVADYSGNDEYPGVETRPEGETHLLYGPNVTGKTMTFSALSHAVLHDPMQTSPGHSCSVGVKFTDESHLHRGQPKTTFETNRYDSKSENVKSRMNEVLGRRPILQAYFLHSETSELPLSKLGIDTILDIVRSVTVPGVQDEIAEKRREKNRRERERDTAAVKQQDTEREIEEVDRKIDRVEVERDAAENVVRLGNTGELETIRNALEDQDTVAAELDSLLAERDEVEGELRDAEQHHEKLQRELQEPLRQLEQDIIENKHCPVCTETVPEPTVQSRIEDDECPFCGMENSIGDYLDNFKQAKQTAESQIDGVRESIEQLTERLDEIDDKIEAVRSDQPDLSEFDAAVRERLEAHDREVSAVVDAARDDRKAAADTLDGLRQRRRELSTQREELETRRRRLTEETEELKDEISELQGEARNGIEEFTQTWRDLLEAMTETIRRGLDITAEKGIQIGGSSPRNYSPENLSTSEMHVLNLSFAVAVNETVDPSRAALDTIVIDEPFTHFDDEVREEVVSFVLDDDRQYIFTSSDPAVADSVPSSQQERLERGDVQWELGSIPTGDDAT
jgi:energy-coupling factor transporter ATP-binding protein EcfA2